MPWFDATQHNPELQAQGMPVGKYPVLIKTSGARANQSGTGGLLFIGLEIMDGPHKGVTGQITLNIWNQNDQAKEIAGRQLSAICHATNTIHLDAKPEGVELWGKYFILEMAQQKGDSKYTEIIGVYDVQGNAPVKATAPAPAAAKPAFQPTPAAAPPAAAPPAAAGGWPGAAQAQPQPAQQPAPQFQQPANTAPQAAQAGGQPSWAQQPAAGQQPAWARP
jgi:hypothetical protein